MPMNETSIRCILSKNVTLKSFTAKLKPDFSGIKYYFENDGSNGLDIYGYLVVSYNTSDHTIFFSELSKNHLDSSVLITGDTSLAFIADANDDILAIFNTFLNHFGGYLLDERHSYSYVEYIPSVLTLEL